MVTKTELRELIEHGENSGVEFTLDMAGDHSLAKELVAFANLQGGRVLLGVGDDGRVHGLTGMGVPRTIIRGMREHNGTEPDLVEDGERFIVRLWKEPRT